MLDFSKKADSAVNRLPDLPVGDSVIAVVSDARKIEGHKGNFFIFEMKVLESKAGSSQRGFSFKKLIDLDRSYAGKYYGLADVFTVLETLNGEKFEGDTTAAANEYLTKYARGSKVAAKCELRPGKKADKKTGKIENYPTLILESVANTPESIIEMCKLLDEGKI